MEKLKLLPFHCVDQNVFPSCKIDMTFNFTFSGHEALDISSKKAVMVVQSSTSREPLLQMRSCRPIAKMHRLDQQLEISP